MHEVVFRLVPALLAVILLWLAYWWIWRSTRRRQPKFTTEAQRAISFARVEAERLRSPTIDAVHLLLGLLHVPLATIVRLLPLEEHPAIRQEVEEHVGGGAIVNYRDDLPFSEEARKVLVAAAREARGLDARQIGAEHLLLGLLHSDSLAALILRERGLRLEPLRAQVGGWQA
jgi:ATP-dependent Clp protease ATP-binding subunit ClpC